MRGQSMERRNQPREGQQKALGGHLNRQQGSCSVSLEAETQQVWRAPGPG